MSEPAAGGELKISTDPFAKLRVDPFVDMARLRAIEGVAIRLWPAVRFFGLCGASPEYVAAVAELGELLSKSGGPQEAAEAVKKARAEMLPEIAALIRESPEIRGKAGRGLTAEIAELVGNLRVQ